MNELESNPRGYVIQLYQYALRYKYNNTQLVEYINSLIDDAEEFKKAQSAKYTVLGDFDSIEINEVFHFRQYHDVSEFAKRWVGKRQCMLLYDISDEETPSRLYYERTDNKQDIGWHSDYYGERTGKRFLCLSMLSLTNDISSRCQDIGSLIKKIRKTVLSVVDSVNDAKCTDILCDVFGTFNTSEMAILWLCDEYVDILHMLEEIQHIEVENEDRDERYNAFLTSFSVIAIQKQLNIDTDYQFKGDAIVQISTNDEYLEQDGMANIKTRLQEELEKQSPGQVEILVDTTVGEYDWIAICPASAILKLLNPQYPFPELHIAERSSDGKGKYSSNYKIILQHSTRLLIGSEKNSELLSVLSVLRSKNGLVVKDAAVSGHSDDDIIDAWILKENRKLYFGSAGLRKKLKSCIHPSTGVVDTMDLLFTDYQSVISTAYSRIWAEDIHSQFNAVLRLIDKLADNKDTPIFWDGYLDLTNAFKQQVFHLTQASRLFFEIPASHLRATGHYDFLMHAYYGMSKLIIELIYMIQGSDKQSELVPLLTVNTEPQVKSELFFPFDRDGVRTMNLIIPNSVLTDPYRGMIYLVHEFFHHVVPKSRKDRNYRLGTFLIERIFRYQIFIILKHIILNQCPAEIRSDVENYVDYNRPEGSKNNPEGSNEFAELFLGLFDGELLMAIEADQLVDELASMDNKYKADLDELHEKFEIAAVYYATERCSDHRFAKICQNAFRYYANNAYSELEKKRREIKEYEKQIDDLKKQIEGFEKDSDLEKSKKTHIKDLGINLKKEEHKERILEWILSRLLYYGCAQAEDFESLISVIRLAEQKNSHGLFSDQKALYKGITEACSDIAAITMLGLSLTDYVLFFIQNLCDIKRIDDPDDLKLDDEKITILRYSVTIHYCFLKSDKSSGKEVDISEPIGKNYDEDYFINNFSFMFMKHKEKPNGSLQDQIDKLKDKAKKWVEKLDLYFVKYYWASYCSYVDDIFFPILKNADVKRREEELKSSSISYDQKLGERVSAIRQFFNDINLGYREIRSKLVISDYGSMLQYMEQVFNTDIRTVQRFQNQKSLYQLKCLNDLIFTSKSRTATHPVIDASLGNDGIKDGIIVKGEFSEELINATSYKVYSWEELQHYLKIIGDRFGRINDIKEGFEKPYSQIWYRGQTSVRYLLEPTLFREVKDIKNTRADISLCQVHRTQFEYFKTQIDGTPEIPFYGDFSMADYNALMQHYGLSSNLLDFTENVFIALYLALKYYSDEELIDNKDQAKKKQRDVVLVAFNPAGYNRFRKETLSKKLDALANGITNYTKEELYKLGGVEFYNNHGLVPNLSIKHNEELYERFLYGNETLDTIYEFGKEPVDTLPIAAWTPRLNHRIRAQSGSFVAFDLYADAGSYQTLEDVQDEYIRTHGKNAQLFMYKIVIDKSCCSSICESLKLMGFNRYFVYPEIEQVKYRFKK